MSQSIKENVFPQIKGTGGKMDNNDSAQTQDDKMFKALSRCYDDYLKGNKQLMKKILEEITNQQKDKELIRSWVKVFTRKLIDIFKNRQEPNYLVEVFLYQMPWFEAGNEFEFQQLEQEKIKQPLGLSNLTQNERISDSFCTNSNSKKVKYSKGNLLLKKSSPHFELFDELSKFIMTVLSFRNAFTPQIITFLVSNIVPIEVKEIDGCKKSEIEVIVGGQIFENQIKLILFIRNILNKYELNSISDVQELTNEDATFLLAVLRYHPNSKEKLSKFKKLMIGQAQFDESISRCLFIINKDRQKVDISYVKSVQNMVDEQFYKKGLKQGSPNQKQMMIQITELIAKISQIYPLYQNDLCKIISECYPHRIQGEEFHKIFLTNILHLAIRNPFILSKILFIVVQKLLEIDSEIKIDHIEGKGTGQTSQIMAEKLDWLMLIVFEFIDFQMKDRIGEDTCFGEIEKSTSSQSERDQLEGKFFKVFLNVFCEQVLITYQSKYVQFIIFYLCSLRLPFQKAFLNQLMDNITKKNPLLYKSTQLNSIYYLGSYLARAKYVDKTIISTIFNDLLNHLTSYLAKFVEQTKEDTYNEALHKIHRNLYHLLQTMLYIMCFRFNAFSDKDNLQRFLMILRKACDDLNALYFISPTIQSVFLDVCKYYGATEFIDLLETSQEILRKSALKNQTQKIEEYFPFDPYCLQYSDKYICEIYQNWQEFNLGDYESLDLSQRKGDDSKQTKLKPSQNNNLNNSFIISQTTPKLEPIYGNCNISRLQKDNYYGFNIDKLNNINEFQYDKDNMIQEITEEFNSSQTKTNDSYKQKQQLVFSDIQKKQGNKQNKEDEESYSLKSQVKATKKKEGDPYKGSKKYQKHQISTTDNSSNTTPIIQANNEEEDNLTQDYVKSQQTTKKHQQKQHHKDQNQNIQQQENDGYFFNSRNYGFYPTKKQKIS